MSCRDGDLVIGDGRGDGLGEKADAEGCGEGMEDGYRRKILVVYVARYSTVQYLSD